MSGRIKLSRVERDLSNWSTDELYSLMNAVARELDSRDAPFSSATQKTTELLQESVVAVRHATKVYETTGDLLSAWPDLQTKEKLLCYILGYIAACAMLRGDTLALALGLPLSTDAVKRIEQDNPDLLDLIGKRGDMIKDLSGQYYTTLAAAEKVDHVLPGADSTEYVQATYDPVVSEYLMALRLINKKDANNASKNASEGADMLRNAAMHFEPDFTGAATAFLKYVTPSRKVNADQRRLRDLAAQTVLEMEWKYDNRAFAIVDYVQRLIAEDTPLTNEYPPLTDDERLIKGMVENSDDPERMIMQWITRYQKRQIDLSLTSGEDGI